MSEHLADEETFLADAEGWMHARCTCGFSFGPLPGPDEVVDVLMEHASEAAEATLAVARETLKQAEVALNGRLNPQQRREAAEVVRAALDKLEEK